MRTGRVRGLGSDGLAIATPGIRVHDFGSLAVSMIEGDRGDAKKGGPWGQPFNSVNGSPHSSRLLQCLAATYSSNA